MELGVPDRISNLRRFNFRNGPADGADLMNMVFIVITRLVFCLPDETVPDNKAQLDEEPHRIVQCRTGDTEIPCLKF